MFDATKIKTATMIADELLASTKASKKKELEDAFEVSSKMPVTVGTKLYNGGKESAQALRDYIQTVTESGETLCYIWDTTNIISMYTLAEANAIKLAIANAMVLAEFNLRTKKNEVDVAITVTAVNAVVW